MTVESTPSSGQHRGPVVTALMAMTMTAAMAVAGSGCAVVAGGGEPDQIGAVATADAAVGGGESVDDDGRADEVLEVPGDTIPTRPEVVIPTNWDSAIEEVYGRYWLYWEAFAAAHALPNADPSFEPLRSLSTDENWESLNEQLSAFADDGLVLVLPENSITEHLVRLPNSSVLTGDEGDEVVLQDCWVDDFVQQTVDGHVLVEAKEAKLMNVVMKVVKGQWRVDGVARATAESDGFEQCQSLISQ
ncbi:MAG: hypothetical protein ACR2QK_07920 [Acidimicrobiales bacterium]